MKYAITHTTKYAYSDPASVCHNIAHLEPRHVPHQQCDSFRLLIAPEPFELHSQMDPFGNRSTYFSIEQAHKGLTVTSKSLMHVRPPQQTLESDSWEAVAAFLKRTRTAEALDVYQYAFPTARTQPFADLEQYTRKSFTPGRSVFEAANELTERIFTEFTYDDRATNVSTPIEEVFASRRGVCQDFAHLQLACIRSLGLAARYVSGYLRTYPPPGKPRLVGVDASHAWLSVYCGADAGWIDFDPTNNLIPVTDHITLAWGRDYNDVCPIRGVILGGGTHQMSLSVDVEPLADG